MADQNQADRKAAAARNAENKALSKDADRRLQALNRSVVRGRPRNQKGRPPAAVVIPVAGVGLFLWGWTHSSRTPDGRFLLALTVVGLVVLLLATGALRYRRREQPDAAHTQRVEAGIQQDTSAEHYLDGA